MPWRHRPDPVMSRHTLLMSRYKHVRLYILLNTYIQYHDTERNYIIAVFKDQWPRISKATYRINQSGSKNCHESAHLRDILPFLQRDDTWWAK